MDFKLFIFVIGVVIASVLLEGQASKQDDVDDCLLYCKDFNKAILIPGDEMDCDNECQKDDVLSALKNGFVKKCEERCAAGNRVDCSSCKNATYDPRIGLLEEIKIIPMDTLDSDPTGELEACET